MNLSEILAHNIALSYNSTTNIYCRGERSENKNVMCLLYDICRDLLTDFHGRFISIWNDLNSSFVYFACCLCDRRKFLLYCTQPHSVQSVFFASILHLNEIMFTSQQTMMMHHRTRRTKPVQMATGWFKLIIQMHN